LTFTPYSQAYPAGFEDMQRRVPDITKAKGALDWSQQETLIRSSPMLLKALDKN
jgi:UDP-glucose 4-epimerase